PGRAPPRPRGHRGGPGLDRPHGLRPRLRGPAPEAGDPAGDRRSLGPGPARGPLRRRQRRPRRCGRRRAGAEVTAARQTRAVRGIGARARTVRAYPPVNRLLTAVARPLARGSFRLSQALIRHLPRAGSARSRLPNGRELVLESDGDDPWTSQLFWQGWAGFYEPEVLPLFYALARRSRAILDVGASVGIYALGAA